MDLLSTLRGDLGSTLGWRPAFQLMTVRTLAVVLFRLSQAAGRAAPLLGYALKQLNHILTGADLAWQAEVGTGLVLWHPTGVVIGPHVRIGRDCRLQQGVTIGGFGGDQSVPHESPVIGNNVSVGAGARILGPITIGNDVVVGANAVVLQSVEAGHLAVGVPAKSRLRSG